MSMVSRSCTQPIRISDGLVDLRVPHVLMSTSGGHITLVEGCSVLLILLFGTSRLELCIYLELWTTL